MYNDHTVSDSSKEMLLHMQKKIAFTLLSKRLILLVCPFLDFLRRVVYARPPCRRRLVATVRGAERLL